jgi:hypothetical protein
MLFSHINRMYVDHIHLPFPSPFPFPISTVSPKQLPFFNHVHYCVGIKDPLVPKTDTQETEKILKRQFLLIKRVQACTHSRWADTQAQNGWQWFSLYPWCSCIYPSPGRVQVKGSQPFSMAKRLRGWVRAHNLAGNFHGQWDCTRIQKKKQEPFKQCNSSKMVTWGILSNLRGWHTLW